jgi:hypothetical protein
MNAARIYPRVVKAPTKDELIARLRQNRERTEKAIASAREQVQLLAQECPTEASAWAVRERSLMMDLAMIDGELKHLERIPQPYGNWERQRCVEQGYFMRSVYRDPLEAE